MIKQIRKEPTYIILIVSIVLSLICIGMSLKSRYFPFNPISPPMTNFGDDVAFDSVTEQVNQKWLFLYEQENKIISTDIYGKEHSVLFNIKEITGDNDAFLLGYSSISPCNSYIASNYRVKKDNEEIIDRLIIYKMRKNEFVDILPIIPGYKMAWDNPPTWLSDKIFLVKMHKFTTDAHSEEIVFIRYDINDLPSEEQIALIPCPHTKTIKHDTHTLLLSNDCQSNPPIYAIDTNGLRLASNNEVAYFNYYSEDCFRNILDGNCLKHKFYDFPSVRIERVVDFNFFDPFGNSAEINRNRFYVYLNEEIVRISDSYIEFEPIWEPEIGLFIWKEGDDTYLMDEQGHSHVWFQGEYVGMTQRDY